MIRNRLINIIGLDGLLHFSCCAIIAVICKLSFSVLAAVVVSLTIGILKEAYDKWTGRGTAEWKDIICDIAGTLIGVL